MPSKVSPPLIPIVPSLEPLVATKSMLLVDIWGVMHNGVSPYLSAAAACTSFRQKGGVVLLLSNSPRPAPSLVQQLKSIGVPASAYDAVLSSGDAALLLIQKAAEEGRKISHIGPERDLGLFACLTQKLVSHSQAQTVVCSGLYDDESEGPENYIDVLKELASRNVLMICANPDITVERGGKIIYCAGAIAQTYEALGGIVEYVGKPYLPIYKLAFERLAELSGQTQINSREVLAIGDGVGTDMEGAHAAGIDAVFIASGVHVGHKGTLDEGLLMKLFKGTPFRPIAAMQELRW